MAAKSWSTEEVERFTELAAEGLSAAQIAKRIGRSRSAVIGKSHRTGIKLLTAPPQRNETLRFFPATRTVIKPKMARAAPRPPREIIVAAPQRTNTLRIDELKPRSCKFPTNRGPHGEWCFCADTARYGPYCEEHAELCAGPALKKKVRR